jgi:hypothetical protein
MLCLSPTFTWSLLTGSKMDKWEEHFHDWVKLLESAKAVDLMKDPQAIWDESWRQAIMQCMMIVEHYKPDSQQILIERMQDLLK